MKGNRAKDLEHPTANPLSRDAYWRMRADPRYVSGAWTEVDWLWEEVRQLNATLRIYADGNRDLVAEVARMAKS